MAPTAPALPLADSVGECASFAPHFPPTLVTLLDAGFWLARGMDATRWVGIRRRRTLLTRTRGTAATYGALGAAGGFLVAPFVWYPALKRQAGKSPGILACSMLSAASTGVFGACFGAYEAAIATEGRSVRTSGASGAATGATVVGMHTLLASGDPRVAVPRLLPGALTFGAAAAALHWLDDRLRFKDMLKYALVRNELLDVSGDERGRLERTQRWDLARYWPSFLPAMIRIHSDEEVRALMERRRRQNQARIRGKDDGSE